MPPPIGRGSWSRCFAVGAALLVGACFVNPFAGEALDHGSARLAPFPAPAVDPLALTGTQPFGIDAGRDGTLFIPASYDPSVPMPALVLLHGATGAGSQMVSGHQQLADSIGIILFAPDSRAVSWDAIVGFFDRDIEFIDEAMDVLLARYNVDRSRLAVGGFSDGASYAFSLGLANGDRFTHVILHSPGMRLHQRLHGKPRFFIAHGRQDAVLPAGATALSFVPFLRTFGYDVRYEEWEGPHMMSLSLVRESLIWLKGG